MITGAVVPLYVHPLVDPGAWKVAHREGPGARCVVVNVADGPGEAAPDDEYVTWVARLTERSVRVAGYVDCGYGARRSDLLRADVERWRKVYGVRSFFLDRFPSTAATPTTRAVRWLRDTGAELVVANPGVEAHGDATTGVDISVAFEGPWRAYRSGILAGTVKARSSRDIAHLVYAVPRNQHQRAHALARELGALVYVTSGDGANPWGHLREARSLASAGLA
ncbi:spherulation-specific family 4 protein [Dermatophilaceae bacterium Soc4.6]